MQAIVAPSGLKGKINAPASKSAMQRACAAALLKKGKTILQNPGISADDKAALDIIHQLGATIDYDKDTIIINSNGIKPVSSLINCGESGLSVRMFTSIAALSNQQVSITGTGSLLKRPLSFFDEVLPRLNVAIASDNGFLPLNIKGPLTPKDIEIDGSLSSQFLTGLLMAYAAAEAGNVTITVANLNSRPYIDLTLSIMQKFGLKQPFNRDYKEFYFDDKPVNKPAKTINYTVEADWSGGAFLLVAGAIAGDINIKGLNLQSTQADKTILQALSQSGANISIEADNITVRESSLKAFNFNATDCPDLFPPLVALAAYSEGTTVIEGVNRLTHKESNRALTLKEEFEKMGIEIKLQDNLMLVKGSKIIKGVSADAHHDHRIAMACGIAALKADNKMIISGAEAVNKSYPVFWQHLKQLGADVTLKEN